jgi:probable rRNA maturation factor
MHRIDVNDLQSHVPGARGKIIEALDFVLRAEGAGPWALSVAVVDDAAMRRLNRRFSGRDRPTDVLSFPLSDAGEEGLSGEIVVSAERARAVADRHGTDPVAELMLYVVHGALHLVGYDDGSSDAARRMHAREREVLSALGHVNVRSGAAPPGDDAPRRKP